MRAPFNNLCNMYLGAPSPGHGALIGLDVPCRFVPQVHVTPTDLMTGPRIGWITTEFVAPLPAVVSSTVSQWRWNLAGSGQLEFVSAPGVFYRIVFGQRFATVSTPPYYQYWLCLMPY